MRALPDSSTWSHRRQKLPYVRARLGHYVCVRQAAVAFLRHFHLSPRPVSRLRLSAWTLSREMVSGVVEERKRLSRR